MEELIEIKILNDYKIWMRFSDNSEKTLDFKPYFNSEFTKDLLIKENFNKVTIDSGGGLSWYNGYDFCPNFLKTL